MKKLMAIVALGVLLVLPGSGAGARALDGGHGILLLGFSHADDSWRIFLWQPGSPVKPLVQSGSVDNGGDFDVRMSDGFWSPDGRSIAYEEDYPGGLAPPTPTVDVMRLDGTHRKTLASGPDGEDVDGPPSWSPDGREIVFDESGDFVVVDVASRHKRYLPPARSRGVQHFPGDPVWGTGGIAYTSGTKVMLLDPATGQSRVLRRGVPADAPLAWSPRGTLAVVEPTRILLLAASGHVLGTFTRPDASRAVCAVAWSRDGKQLLAATSVRDKYGAWKGILGLWAGSVGTKHWRSVLAPAAWNREGKYECALSWR